MLQEKDRIPALHPLNHKGYPFSVKLLFRKVGDTQEDFNRPYSQCNQPWEDLQGDSGLVRRHCSYRRSLESGEARAAGLLLRKGLNGSREGPTDSDRNTRACLHGKKSFY